MVNVLWREAWLKPLLTESLANEKCKLCNHNFKDFDFVTSCEFCEIGIIHESCCNEHIVKDHRENLDQKITKHTEKRLHSFQ